MVVTCYNKTYPIFRCDLEGTKILKVTEIIDEDRMPILLQDGVYNDLEKVNAWVESRLIPAKRDGLATIRKLYKFENYHNMFSLSDQYWFQYTSRETWKKMNYFRNRYQSETGKLFFAPWTVNKNDLKKEGPDLTTNGILRKRWVQGEPEEEGGAYPSYLIKAGCRNGGQNPISEVLVSMMLGKLRCIPYVEYKLICEGLKICSICKNFIDENTEYVPCSHIYFKIKREKSDTPYKHIIKTAEKYGVSKDESVKYLDAMIAVDSVTFNKDRHLNNFGFLRDVNTGQVTGYAPLFDNGSAYMPTKDNANEMFKDREQKALEKIITLLELKDIDINDMIKLAETFPTTTEKEKEYMISRIRASRTKVVRIKDKSRTEDR